MDKKIRAYLTARAREGGHARAKALTADERRESAKVASAARWGKRRKGSTKEH